MDLQCHALTSQGSADYFVIEFDGKAFCLLCSNTIAMLKEYSTCQHYQPTHSSKYSQLTGK